MALLTTLNLQLNANLSGTSKLGTPTHPMVRALNQTLTNGAGSNQADHAWADSRTLAGSSSEDLDLAGTLTNGLGETVDLDAVKAILIVNKSTTPGDDLEIGGAASNGFDTFFGASDDVLVVRAGGAALLWAPLDGYEVNAGTGDVLKVSNPGSNSIGYDIIVVGVEAA